MFLVDGVGVFECKENETIRDARMKQADVLVHDRMVVYLRRYVAGAGNGLNLGPCRNIIACMWVWASRTGSRSPGC
jgi:hypothetical protein